jgi:hypothetical protein
MPHLTPAANDMKGQPLRQLASEQKFDPKISSRASVARAPLRVSNADRLTNSLDRSDFIFS